MRGDGGSADGSVGDRRARRRQPRHPSARQLGIEYARGIGGGLFLGLPLLMTMEMWRTALIMPPWKLLLFLVVDFGALLILEYYSGFREEETFAEVAEDALVAFGIGVALSAVLLFVLGLVTPEMSAREALGKIGLQAIPASIGASVAMSQLGQRSAASQGKTREAGFWGSQAVALAGALVFGFNIAPTEEPMLLGLWMRWWHALILALLSLLQVHVLVYAVDFRGAHAIPRGRTWWEVFVQESVTSYAVAVLLAAYLLWTFGRIGAHTGAAETVHMVVALSFATSLGAAAGKLIL
ncbi:MAG TPA: TIGR02587 family membrane protein [Longimicrobiales bacterium]